MKFKKHFLFFLAFFLLVSNTGFSFNVHFCGDKIASISLKTEGSNQNLDVDGCGTVEKKSNCCNDKFFSFHNNIEQVIVKTISSEVASSVLIPISKPIVFTALPNFTSIEIPSYYCDTHASPLFKLYQQYIFYDTI